MDDNSLPVKIQQRGLRLASEIAMPALLLNAGDSARFAFEEFFHGQIRNPHTRRNYLLALRAFSDWCQAFDISERAKVARAR